MSGSNLGYSALRGVPMVAGLSIALPIALAFMGVVMGVVMAFSHPSAVSIWLRDQRLPELRHQA
jgi:hypothetical protein